MKQCDNCRAWVQLNDSVCRYCGTNLYASNHPIARAKKFWESTTFFVAVIIFSVYAAGEIGVFVYDLFFNDPIADIRNTYQFLKELGLEISELSIFFRSEFDYVMPIYNSVRGLSLIFPLLTLSGLWVFYASCKTKPETNPVNPFGGILLKVGSIVKLFVSAIVAVGALILSIWVLLKSFSTGDFSLLFIVSLLLGVVFLSVVGAFYDIGLWRTISAVQEKVSTGNTKKTISFYVIVINIAFFVCSVLLAPANLFAAASSTLVSLLRNSALFMFALVLINYRSKIQNPPRQPAPAPMPIYPNGMPYYNAPQQSPYAMPQYLAPVQQQNVQPLPAPQCSTPPQAAGYPNQQGMPGR